MMRSRVCLSQYLGMRRIMEEVEDVEVAAVVHVEQVVGMEKSPMIMVTKKRNENLVEQVVVVTNSPLSSRRDTCKKTKQMLS